MSLARDPRHSIKPVDGWKFSVAARTPVTVILLLNWTETNITIDKGQPGLLSFRHAEKERLESRSEAECC